jgi:hypothetical protein
MVDRGDGVPNLASKSDVGDEDAMLKIWLDAIEEVGPVVVRTQLESDLAVSE